MSRHAWMLVLLVGCGEPVLRNAPKPNPGAVAGVAAATAAAITLASPQTAAAQQEARSQGEPDNRGVKVKETVPGAVFDRIDGAPGDAGVDGAASASSTPVAASSAPGATSSGPTRSAPGAATSGPTTSAPGAAPSAPTKAGAKSVPAPQAWQPSTPPTLPAPPAAR